MSNSFVKFTLILSSHLCFVFAVLCRVIETVLCAYLRFINEVPIAENLSDSTSWNF